MPLGRMRTVDLGQPGTSYRVMELWPPWGVPRLSLMEPSVKNTICGLSVVGVGGFSKDLWVDPASCCRNRGSYGSNGFVAGRSWGMCICSWATISYNCAKIVVEAGKEFEFFVPTARLVAVG